jgi:hypothetical protein
MQIEDGSGTGKRAKVDNDLKLNTRAVTESEFDNATLSGKAFNINTEFITVTNATEIPLLYLKNNEQEDLVIAAWFVGTDNAAGSATRLSLLKAYPNPTAGTIITAGNDLEAVNRAIGNTNTLDAVIKSGGDGFTFTANTTPVLYQTQGSSARAFGNVQLCVKKGSSILITSQMYGLTSLDIYTGFQVYKTNTNQ